MKKDNSILTIILRLLKGIDKNIEDIKNIDILHEDSSEFHSTKNPIIIPPEVYKEICKILKSKNIGFMGIS